MYWLACPHSPARGGVKRAAQLGPAVCSGAHRSADGLGRRDGGQSAGRGDAGAGLGDDLRVGCGQDGWARWGVLGRARRLASSRLDGGTKTPSSRQPARLTSVDAKRAEARPRVAVAEARASIVHTGEAQRVPGTGRRAPAADAEQALGLQCLPRRRGLRLCQARPLPRLLPQRDWQRTIADRMLATTVGAGPQSGSHETAGARRSAPNNNSQLQSCGQRGGCLRKPERQSCRLGVGRVRRVVRAARGPLHPG